MAPDIFSNISVHMETFPLLPIAIMQQAMWLQAWVGWMVLVNLGGALIFFRQREAKWVLLAFLLAAILMQFLYMEFGYQRILGLAHVIFWTPLLIVLWTRRLDWDLNSLSGKWLATLFTTNLISLVIDYIDVLRYISGERLPVV